MVVGEEARETAHFVDLMDKWFDALNVSIFTNCARHRSVFVILTVVKMTST